MNTKVLILLSVCSACIASAAYSQYMSPPVATVKCISTATSCSSANSLETVSLSSYPTVFAQGYYSPGDGGGGTFINLGNLSSSACAANGGTRIQDGTTSPGPNCFQRINSTYGPREFGAFGDNSHGGQTAAALNAWLANPQPHVGDVGSYLVTNAVVCPSGTTIQGPASNNAGGNGTPTPPFYINAGGSFSDPTNNALFVAQGYCRVTGVALDANNVTNTATSSLIDTVLVAGTHVTVDGHSLIEHGRYNVNCTAGIDGLRLNDSQFIQSSSDNIYMLSGCANTRMVGDIISGAGNEGVNTGSIELTIADGVIEQSRGTGLDLNGASKVSIGNMFFDDNGKGNPIGDAGPGIMVNSVNTVSICGNHLTGNGGEDPAAAQIKFSGNSHGVVFCGNAYAAENQSSQVALKPAYVYDMATGATLTDTHFYESPPVQAFGVYATSKTQQALQPLHVPDYSQNQFSGLTLANHTPGTPSAIVDINAGSAADSTNSALLSLSQTCSVNLNSNGAGGLDTGSVQPNTTYYFFVIGNPGSVDAGISPSTCIASASLTPAFTAAAFGSNSYLRATHGWAETANSTLYNVGSVNGVIPGQAIDSPDTPDPIATGTTISAFSTSNATATTSSGASSGATSITFSTASVLPPGGIHAGMKITDLTDSTCLQPQTVITSVAVSMSTIIQINPAVSCGAGIPSGTTLNFSGENQVALSKPAVASTPVNPTGSDLNISVGLYRLVGALYTDALSNVVQFNQDGDTFYLVNPAVDIDSNATLVSGTCKGVTFTSTQTSCPLSVPKGIKVEAFGRMLGGTSNKILISSQDSSPGTPTNLDNSPSPSQSPGFATSSSTGTTAYPFRIYTDTSGTVRMRASGGTNKAFEDTDGWVYRRGQ